MKGGMIVLLVVFAFLVVMVFARLSTMEDAFIRNSMGQWVRHGNPSIETARKFAVREAQKLFLEKKQEGMDFSAGPCLTNEIIQDWVVDTSHNPRLAIDDDPNNQCVAFREGKAHHFVELDLNGEVIKTY